MGTEWGGGCFITDGNVARLDGVDVVAWETACD